MNTLQKLEALGYEFTASGSALQYTYTRPGEPPEEARSLLAHLKTVKAHALRFWKKRRARLAAGKQIACNDLVEFCERYEVEPVTANIGGRIVITDFQVNL